MLISACEGSCRMCPFTTMSSNNAPSESRPLAMWVILRISPNNININKHYSNLKWSNFRYSNNSHKHHFKPTVCIYLNSVSMLTCGKLHLCLSPEAASCQRVAIDSLSYLLRSSPIDGVQDWDELSHCRTLKLKTEEHCISFLMRFIDQVLSGAQQILRYEIKT